MPGRNDASAQQIPPGVNPGQLERRFEAPRVPQAHPDLVVPKVEESRPPDNAEEIRFVLTGIVLDGVTVYDEADLLPLYRVRLGTKISVAEVYRIATAITARYRNDGYILSRTIVPPQTIQGGILHLRVIEGYIDGFRIEGNPGDARGRIEQYGTAIAGTRPVTASVLERYLLLINDLPGISAQAVLVPSADAVGASTVNLIVTREPFVALASLDNRGSRYVGPYQAEVSLDLNGLFRSADRTNLRVIGATQLSELRFFEVTHEELVSDEGTKLIVAARQTLSEPGFTLEPLEVESRSVSADITLTHPFIRSRPENLTGRLAFGLRDSKTEVLGSEFSNDRVRALRAGATFDFVDRFRAVNLVDVEMSQGLDILDATETGSANLSRARGKSDFFKITASASRLQQLTGPLSVLVAAKGQYTNDPLLVSEEFSLGGADFGSAYDPSELSGDRGAAVRLELRYDGTVGARYLQAVQPYMFYDLGAVWNVDPGAGQNERQSLSSAGVGMRARLTDRLAASFEVAVPLTRAVAAAGDDGDDTRFFFKITGTY